MPGRKRIPEKLKNLRGRPDKSKPRKELKVKTSRPPMPENLTAEGKKEWKRAIDAAMGYEIVSDLDFALCWQYIELFETIRMLQEKCRKDGHWIATADGHFKRAPWDTALVQYRQRFQSVCSDLGWTPVARSKVVGAEPEEELDPFTVFEGGKK